MAERVRVLIVDDSSFYRKRISSELNKSPKIEVVGEAANGEEALALTRRLSPDLVTMDVAMPVMDGITAVRRIMQDHPTPIIMFSALTRDGARSTLDALDAGAVDFLPKMLRKPGQGSVDSMLRDRVLEYASCRPLAEIPPAAADQPAPVEPPRPAARERTAPGETPRLLVIGASTGGPVAVQKLLGKIPADFPIPILVAIHMPGTFTSTYAQRLGEATGLRVSEAHDGALLRPGEVLVAPGGFQCRVRSRRGTLSVSIEEGATGDLYRPSIDHVLDSVADNVGAAALGVVLTGMGADGARGAAHLQRVGGRIWAQDEGSSVVYGMPRAVAEAGIAEKILPLEEVAPALLEIF